MDLPKTFFDLCYLALAASPSDSTLHVSFLFLLILLAFEHHRRSCPDEGEKKNRCRNQLKQYNDGSNRHEHPEC